jgi:hypothetical protein
MGDRNVVAVRRSGGRRHPSLQFVAGLTTQMLVQGDSNRRRVVSSIGAPVRVPLANCFGFGSNFQWI